MSKSKSSQGLALKNEKRTASCSGIKRRKGKEVANLIKTAVTAEVVCDKVQFAFNQI